MCLYSSKLGLSSWFFAEGGGFEPPVQLPVRQFSKLLVSATHPSFPFQSIFLHWLGVKPKATAKVLLFFDMTKYFLKKKNFIDFFM